MGHGRQHAGARGREPGRGQAGVGDAAVPFGPGATAAGGPLWGLARPPAWPGATDLAGTQRCHAAVSPQAASSSVIVTSSSLRYAPKLESCTCLPNTTHNSNSPTPTTVASRTPCTLPPRTL